MKGVWEVISSYDYKKRSRRQRKVKRMKENRDREREREREQVTSNSIISKKDNQTCFYQVNIYTHILNMQTTCIYKANEHTHTHTCTITSRLHQVVLQQLFLLIVTLYIYCKGFRKF